MHPIHFAADLPGKIIAALRGRYFLLSQTKQKLRYPSDTGVLGGAKQPKSEPLPSGASLAAISSKVMVFMPSL